MYFSPISQYVSAPPGHPQVNHNIQLCYLKKAIVIPTDPLFLILQMVCNFFTIELLDDLFTIYITIYLG
jgi:hypothetical protein